MGLPVTSVRSLVFLRGLSAAPSGAGVTVNIVIIQLSSAVLIRLDLFGQKFRWMVLEIPLILPFSRFTPAKIIFMLAL